MNYKKLIERLYSVNLHGGIKLGLDNVRRLSQLLNYPENAFESVHIAGTNGKGSVAFKVACSLTLSGKKTGLYTSPHISSFCERIQIDGKNISQEDVIKHLLKIFNLIDEHNIPATFFEITTMVAMDYFSTQKVDYAVLETGLGGRLDATNIVTPKLSIITTIDFDHTEILGSTLDSIAKEKAGIIKPGIPVLLGPKASIVKKFVHSFAKQVEGEFDSFEKENQAIAIKALEILRVPPVFINKGVSKSPPCRFEHIRFQNRDIIFDVAHNPSAFHVLFKEIERKFPKRKIRLVFGLSKNKEIGKCVDVMAKHASFYHVVEASNGRGAKPLELAKILEEKKISQDAIFIHSSARTGAEKAFGSSNSDEVVVVSGTFFIMHEAKECILSSHAVKDAVDLNEKYSLAQP